MNFFSHQRQLFSRRPAVLTSRSYPAQAPVVGKSPPRITRTHAQLDRLRPRPGVPTPYERGAAVGHAAPPARQEKNGRGSPAGRAPAPLASRGCLGQATNLGIFFIF